MPRKYLKIAAVALASAVIAAQVGLAAESGKRTPSEEMRYSIFKMLTDIEAMSVKPDLDKDFVQVMLRHHQARMELAQIQLEHGNDPEIKKISKKALEEQKKYVSKLQGWLEAHSQ